ncbi:MAG: ECF transporter S component [Firmicutes bacterium]|nr:ECF transporter S component [Bacillota bacterium]
MNRKMSTVKMAKLAMMVAISCVLVLLVRIPFPPAPFLVYDPADVPIYITTFAFGPVAGLIVTIVVSFIQAFILGGDALYGFVMHVVATGLFAVVAGAIYKHKKSKKEAIIALAAGVIIATVTMCLLNIVVTPMYLGTPREAVLAMILPVILPFNLIKAGANAVITFLVYKRISGFLHREA